MANVSEQYLEKFKHRTPPPSDFSPEIYFPAGHRLAGVKRCESWSYNNGRQCHNAAVHGKKRCRSHGGMSAGGIASGRFKTGRYSRYLPDRFLNRYASALDDSELLSLQDEIALTDTRIADLLSRVDQGEAGRHWRSIRADYNQLVDAIRKKDTDLLNDAIASLGNSIRAGNSDYSAWDEIISLTDHRRKLVESQRKLLLEKQQLLTAEEASVLMSSLALAVKENITDAGLLSKIQTAFIRIANGGDSRLIRGRFKQESADNE